MTSATPSTCDTRWLTTFDTSSYSSPGVRVRDVSAKMMTGEGPFGSVEMGGMFSVLKVRKNQKAGDYTDPGWYKHPTGEVAYEWTGALPNPARFAAEGGHTMKAQNMPAREIEVQVRKPVMGQMGGKGHGQH